MPTVNAANKKNHSLLQKSPACAKIESSKTNLSVAQSLSVFGILTRLRRAVNERRLGIMKVYGVIYLILNLVNGKKYGLVIVKSFS